MQFITKNKNKTAFKNIEVLPVESETSQLSSIDFN